MPFDSDIHHRRSIRLKDYDYAQQGYYFVTICTQNRESLFGNVVNGEMRLNDAGKIIQSCWQDLPKRFPNIRLDTGVVMPNHLHGIVMIDCRGEPCVRPSQNRIKSPMREASIVGILNISGQRIVGEHKVRPYGTLSNSIGRILQAFKSLTTHEYAMGVKSGHYPPFPGRLWQRNYYEHIIRDEKSYNEIGQYILNNPQNWESDELYLPLKGG